MEAFMSGTLDRREILTGLAGLGTVLIAGELRAQAEHAGHAGHGLDAAGAAPTSPALKAVADATANCLRDGRYCMARCTDHLAAGTPLMAECQRAVMNMLAVVQATADVAGYRNASSANMKALASTCAAFCRTCAKACEPHAEHHAECQACRDACLQCAKACEAFTAQA
ncbi:MAG TPA: Csp1 family four helix bundle copper storage protein [Myxococcales bacterium]|nr:Csp1 family four helix bundle copper storage protein [Myxococcales bacterium]